MFIVIEGIDRIGKSTQVELLKQKFALCGVSTEVFNFPAYDTPTGQVIHEHLHNKLSLTEISELAGETKISKHDALVFQCVQTADKYAMAGEFKNLLEGGEIIICGRWWQSAFVYGQDDGLNASWLLNIHDCLPKADLNILLDLAPEEASSQVTESGDRYERDLDKQKRLRGSYLRLWKARASKPHSGWEIVSAVGKVEEVHDRICDQVSRYLYRFESHQHLVAFWQSLVPKG